MNIWIILIALISIFFSNPSFAFWEEFDKYTDKDGSTRVKGKLRINKHVISVRSTTPEDLKNYITLLEKQKFEYVPVDRVEEFFTNNNLERQKEGRLYHMYVVSCCDQIWGFLHLGRKKTVGVLVGNGWRGYNGETPKLLKLWENLEVVEQSDGGPEKSHSFKRIKNRGLARLLPVLDPTLQDMEKQMCLEVGFNMVCKLAEAGCRLLPEKMVEENREEETLPFQVIVEMYNEDTLCQCLNSAGFKQFDNPSGHMSKGYMDKIFVRAVEKK